MIDFLERLNFVNDDQNDFISFYNQYIGFCLDGENLGINLKDEPSGNLVFNVGMAEIGKEAGKLTINIRYPVTCTEEQVFEPIMPILAKYNMGLIKEDSKDPIYVDPQNPMIKTMMEIYQKETGDTDSQPLVIGGGTYARATPGVIAYGALFPGQEDVMHQKDEYMDLEKFKLMTKIYAEAIYKLSSEGYND